MRIVKISEHSQKYYVVDFTVVTNFVVDLTPSGRELGRLLSLCAIDLIIRKIIWLLKACGDLMVGSPGLLGFVH